MNPRTVLTSLCLALGGALTLPTAHAAGAQDAGYFYLGVDLGQMEYDVDAAGLRPTFLSPWPLPVLRGEATDDSDVAGALYAGYRFSRWIAVEVTWLDAGEFEHATTHEILMFPASQSTFEIHTRARTTGPAISAIGIWPINDTWEIYGRAGVFFADTEVRFHAVEQGGQVVTGGGGGQSFGSEQFLYGIGVAAHFANRWTGRLQYSRTSDAVGEAFGDDSDMDFLSAGVQFRF